MKKIAFFLISSIQLLLIGCSQSKATEQIKTITYQQWVEEHIPAPDTLNDKQLALEAARLTVSICNEEQVQHIFYSAAERFAIPQFSEYADMQRTGKTDICDRMKVSCLEQLLLYAENHFSKTSYEYTYIAWALTHQTIVRETFQERKKVFSRLAETLYKTEPSDRNKELYFYGRLWDIQGDGIFGDPTRTEELIDLLGEMVEFYQDYPDTELKSDLFVETGQILSLTLGYYTTYYSCIGLQLQETGKHYDYFNFVTDTIPVADSLSIIISTNYFWKEGIHTAKRCWHPQHPDYMSVESSYIQNHIYGEILSKNEKAIITYRENLCKYFSDYFGEQSPSTALAKLDMHAVIRAKGDKSRDSEFNALKDIIRGYMLPDARDQYINLLSSEMTVFIDDKSALRNLYKEITQILKDYPVKDPARQLYIRTCESNLQRQGVLGYENAFKKLIFDYEFAARNCVTWDMVAIGKVLINQSLSLFSNYFDAIRIERKVLQMIEQLAGKESLVFKADYVDYCGLTAGAYPTQAQTLDGELSADKLYADLLQKCKGTFLYAEACAAAANYYNYDGNRKKAADLMQQALSDIEQSQQGKDKDFRKREEIEVVNKLITNTYQEGSRKQIDTYIRRLEKLLEQYPEYNNIGSTMVLANYYFDSQNYKKAERVLSDALDLYEKYGYSKIDGSYIQIVTALSSIYLNVYSDQEKARLLAERLSKDIEDIKDYGNYDTEVGLLKAVCEITGRTAPDDIIHYKNIRRYYDKAKEYYAASSQNINIRFNVVADACNSICQTMYKSTDRRLEWYSLYTELRDSIYPELKHMEESYRTTFSDRYTMSEQYFMILWNIAMAQDMLTERDSAENTLNYMEQTFASNHEFAAITDLMYLLHYSYYYSRGYEDSDKMLELANRLKEGFANSPLISSMADVNRFIPLLEFADAADKQDYKKAINHADKFYNETQKYMQQNFDFMTQAEKEAFLRQNGVGGNYIQILVPQVKKKQLIEKAYDINLQQKGLLLRKSDELKHAIHASGRQELIEAYDTLLILQHDLSLVNDENLLIGYDDDAIKKREHLYALERFLIRETQDMPERNLRQVNWQDVRNNLHSDEAAVEYIVQGNVVYALVLTAKSKTPQFVELMNVDQMAALHTIIEDNALDHASKISKLYGADSDLYSQLWSPLEKYFNGAKKIYFSPTDVLNLLSFQAIRVSDTEFLIDSYDLHQLTSTGMLAERKKMSTKTEQVRSANIYGAIFYNDMQYQSDEYIASIRRQHKQHTQPLLAKRLVVDDAFPFLENTLYESDGINDVLLSCGIKTREKIGFAPTEEEIRMLDGNSPSILHIATHGFFIANPKEAKKIEYFKKTTVINPMTCSGLALADAETSWLGQSKRESTDDNILTASEVSELDLKNTQLVVLSACETGLGGVSAEGVFGLQRGFKQAGVRTICASLWSVEDQSTAELMQNFYTYWLVGKLSKQEAMRKAMLTQKTKNADPLYWAPFVMLDDMEQ